MVKHNQSPTPLDQSGKFRAKPLKVPSFELADLGDQTEDKHPRDKSNVQSSQIMSTADLISAVGQIWDCASRSLSHFQPRSCSSNYPHTVTQKGTVIQKGTDLCVLVENDTLFALDGIDSECLHVQLDSTRYFPSIVQQSLEFTRMTRKSCYMPCEDAYVQDIFKGNCDDCCGMNDTWSRGKRPADVGIRCGMSTSSETMKIIKSFMRNAVVCSPLAGNVRFLWTKNLCPCIYTSNLSHQLSNGGSANIKTRKLPLSPLYSNYLLQVFQNTHLTAGTEANYHQSQADDLVKDGIPQFKESNIQGEVHSKSSSTVMNKPRPLLVEHEYAVSGALSGIVVSLCLHPVDTVKTVLQSCQAGQKSLWYIGQSIITERGLSGLYRGISSNITTSAPISAIYTFTYESVKGFLLPCLAKEHFSVAHCTAGACASIATSFIFTPSDHIKQQMQVNSNYHNCWNAALRIIEKGGLISLYSGWGAVLCRNIPHSIIKFYTYERLKQIFISSELPHNQLNTSQTLLCGGLAGSAAALFSTPFDVVKTRLQTQMPGSARKHQNILNVLQQICDHEGVKGLYRGLIPRLVMYMSQGALFFASYEIFQRLLSLDLRHCRSEMLQHNQNSEDDILPV